MRAPLLATKFFVPPPVKSLVIRTRLLAKLNESLQPGCRLTLVSAPAGFGKTTVVSTWTASLKLSDNRLPTSVAWLSLEDGDNDLVIFWSYIITALQTQSKGVGKQALAHLQSSKPSDAETILPFLVNDLAQIQDDFILVLDDFHLIRTPSIHQSLSFFIDHLPPQFHVVILSRTDPPLPLALLRGRGQLLEIRLADLRFTNDEAAVYLVEMLKLALPSTAIEALNAKTEGWAAGLQMAGISLQGRPDPSQFIQSFSGSNRYILDYLVEEVLNRQPEKIKNFLLRTSILKSLCGPLCNVILEEGFDSQSMLEYLEHANLFLVPLDEEHNWYRYHPLFGDLLNTQLEQSIGEIIPDLHLKAAAWYEANHHPIDAVRHWLAASDMQHASRLVEMECERLVRNGMANQALGWLNILPDSLYRFLPKLHLIYSWGLISTGQFNLVEPHLLALEHDMVDDQELENLQAEIDATRATIAFSTGNFESTIQLGQKALADLPMSNHLYSGVLMGMGTAYRLKGKLALACQYLAESAQNAEEMQHYAPAIGSLSVLGDVYMDRGSLRLAKDTYQRCFKLSTRIPLINPLTCLAHAGVSRLYYEWNNLDKAITSVCEALKQVELWGNIGIQAVAYLNKALCELALGKPLEAARSMNSVTEITPELSSNPFVQRTVHALTLQYFLRAGQMGEAYRMIEDKTGDFSTGSAEGPEVELAEISTLIAVGHAHQKPEMLSLALARIDTLLSALHASGLNYLLLQTMVQKVNALSIMDRKREAVSLLQIILAQAEPEGFVRLFIDQWPILDGLIEKIPSSSPQAGYIQRLQAARQQASPKQSVQANEQKYKVAFAEQGLDTRLVERLTWRESEIIRLISEGCSNKEIALRLCISVRTVKYHTAGIYTKLKVNGRTQAMVKARELGLLK